MINSIQSILQLPEFSQGNLLVIDGDALPYAIGWHHREHQEIDVVHKAIDQWFTDFFLLSSADSYIGIIAANDTRCFRYEVYKYKPYKGNRQEKDDWIKFWEPVIREYLIKKYGFVMAPAALETDDIVATLGSTLMQHVLSGDTKCIPYICSPDKDLKQIPGYHIDYRKMIDGGGIQNETISVKDALYKWCMQMLCGDTTDNIAGIPGMGEKKAEALLKEAASGNLFPEETWKRAVKLAYQKYFGPYYGDIIYEETLATITMVTPSHPLWYKYQFEIALYVNNLRAVKKHEQPFCV